MEAIYGLGITTSLLEKNGIAVRLSDWKRCNQRCLAQQMLKKHY
jgi:hypothetical protein